ncbi:MAG: hypothetical protein K6E87_03435 [bacterium]|nr:hypothetical protein [bacterium]
MNKKITLIGLIITLVTTFLFALFLLIDFKMGYFFVCIILAIGYIMMTAGLTSDVEKDKSLKSLALGFGAIYAVLIFIVYFTQVTVVNKGNAEAEVLEVLDYGNMNLMFYLDILGYGIMALSTFFLGLTIKTDDRMTKTFKILLMVHGLFFIPCLIMPMTPLMDKKEGSSSDGGVIALEFWCLYFIVLCAFGLISVLKKKKVYD